MRNFVSHAALVLLGMALAGCIRSPVRAYEGAALPRDERALIRAVGPGRMETDGPGYALLEVEAENPVDGEPASSRFISSFDESPWLAFPIGRQCLVIRARLMRCPPAFEELVSILGSIEGGCQSVNGDRWDERQICFNASGRGEYEIQIDANQNSDCIGGYELTAYNLVDVNTGESRTKVNVEGSCIPSGALVD